MQTSTVGDNCQPCRVPPTAPQVVPGAFIPFGAGSRMCVGMRFAETTALLTLIRLYQQASRSFCAPLACCVVHSKLFAMHRRLAALTLQRPFPAPHMLPSAHRPSFSGPPCFVQFTFRLLPGQVPLKTKVLITQVREGCFHMFRYEPE